VRNNASYAEALTCKFALYHHYHPSLHAPHPQPQIPRTPHREKVGKKPRFLREKQPLNFIKSRKPQKELKNILGCFGTIRKTRGKRAFLLFSIQNDAARSEKGACFS
jgi:hypothetical protein